MSCEQVLTASAEYTRKLCRKYESVSPSTHVVCYVRPRTRCAAIALFSGERVTLQISGVFIFYNYLVVVNLSW